VLHVNVFKNDVGKSEQSIYSCTCDDGFYYTVIIKVDNYS